MTGRGIGRWCSVVVWLADGEDQIAVGALHRAGRCDRGVHTL
jgi:tRNA U38,U39,U40 pseudouridine synthase TruA